MKIGHYRDVPATDPLPGVKKRVVIGPDEGAQNFIMRVFDVAPGRRARITPTPGNTRSSSSPAKALSATKRERRPPSGKGTPSFSPPARSTA